eukprot:c45140_g1_i1 orf=113-343(+)
MRHHLSNSPQVYYSTCPRDILVVLFKEMSQIGPCGIVFPIPTSMLEYTSDRHPSSDLFNLNRIFVRECLKGFFWCF